MFFRFTCFFFFFFFFSQHFFIHFSFFLFLSAWFSLFTLSRIVFINDVIVMTFNYGCQGYSQPKIINSNPNCTIDHELDNFNRLIASYICFQAASWVLLHVSPAFVLILKHTYTRIVFLFLLLFYYILQYLFYFIFFNFYFEYKY